MVGDKIIGVDCLGESECCDKNKLLNIVFIRKIKKMGSNRRCAPFVVGNMGMKVSDYVARIPPLALAPPPPPHPRVLWAGFCLQLQSQAQISPNYSSIFHWGWAFIYILLVSFSHFSRVLFSFHPFSSSNER